MSDKVTTKLKYKTIKSDGIDYSDDSKEKACCICKIKKPITEFHKLRNNKSGYRGCCKSCRKLMSEKHYLKNKERIDNKQKEYVNNNHEKILLHQKDYHSRNKEKVNLKHREWHMKNKKLVSDRHKLYAKINPSYNKTRSLKNLYGITFEQKNQMIIDQNGLCGCCEKPLGIISRNIHTDHDHDSKIVRKILCKSCNSALGFVKEDINVALKLVEYIKYCDSLKGKK